MSTMPTTLGLIEAFDRHGALLARAPITRWPVTVGRALDCDLVLDDPFVAPRHLRIDRAVNEPRTVQVEVLETRNGARLQRKQYGQGEHFDWPDGAPIDLGHTHITLRLADAPIADEQPLPQFPWRTVGTTAALVMLGVPAWLGAQWLNRMRLTNEMYMSSLFPPSLRVAPAAPVDQLLQDAEALRAKLDRRLKDDGLADEDE